MAGGHQSGHIGNRTAADEQTAGGWGHCANAAKPSNYSELKRGRGRSAKPGAIEDIEPGSDRIRHCAHEIVWSRNKREKPGMIDMQIVWQDVALELREKFVRIAT